MYKNTSPGAGIFSFAPSFTCLINDPYSIQVADLDGDGKVDMVSANQAEQTVSLYKNTSTAGSISFAPKVNYTTGPATFPRTSPVGDLDNDGKPDFAYVNQFPASFDIFRNRIGESIANAGPDAAICSGSNFQIGTAAISGYTYSWSSNPAGFTSSVANPLVSPVVNTSYYLTVTDGVVTAKDTVIINVNPSPTANAGTNVTICSSSSTQLNALGGGVYSWSPTTGLNNPNIANPVASPVNTTVYTVTVSNPNNCTASANVTVTVSPSVSPAVTVNTANNPACLGSAATFTATPVNGGTTPAYQWQVNGINAGTNSNIFSSNALINNDRVKVILTSNASCLTSTAATSNEVVMNVQQLATPLISLTNKLYSVTNPDAAATYTWQTLTSNSWVNVVPVAHGTTYTATAAGEYRVMAVKGACINYSQSLIVTGLVNSPVNKYGIRIYPNPAHDLITIDSIDLSQNWRTVRVLGVDGTIVLPDVNIANQSTVTINVAIIPSGIYYIFMRRKDYETTSLKFIKE